MDFVHNMEVYYTGRGNVEKFVVDANVSRKRPKKYVLNPVELRDFCGPVYIELGHEHEFNDVIFATKEAAEASLLERAREWATTRVNSPESILRELFHSWREHRRGPSYERDLRLMQVDEMYFAILQTFNVSPVNPDDARAPGYQSSSHAERCS